MTSKSCRSGCFCLGLLFSVLYFPGSLSQAHEDFVYFLGGSATPLKEFFNFNLIVYADFLSILAGAVLGYLYSKCPPQMSKISWVLLRNAESQALPKT